MTKCTFHKFGTSGNIEKHDALCILPLNIGDIFKPIFISATMRESRSTFLHPPGQYRLLPEEGSTQWNHPLCSQRKDLHLHIDLFPLAIFTVIAFCYLEVNSQKRYVFKWKQKSLNRKLSKSVYSPLNCLLSSVPVSMLLAIS